MQQKTLGTLLLCWCLFVHSQEQITSVTPNLAICGNHYPFGESAIILNRLVEAYARTHFITGANDYRREILVINNGAYKLGQQQTYSTVPFGTDYGCTFRFELRKFYSGPTVYVSADDRTENFDTNSIEPFSRLHFRCPTGTRCCALYCCPIEAKNVQELFSHATTPSSPAGFFRFLSRTSVVNANNKTYSLIPLRLLMSVDESQRICVYKLQSFDHLRQTGVHFYDGRQVNYIFYTCNRTEFCCQLRCVPRNRHLFRLDRNGNAPIDRV